MTNRFVIDDEGYIVDASSNKRLDAVGVINTLNEMNSFLSPINEEWNSEEDKHRDTVEVPKRPIWNIDVSKMSKNEFEAWEADMFPKMPKYWEYFGKAIEFITIGCIVGFIMLMAYAIMK